MLTTTSPDSSSESTILRFFAGLLPEAEQEIKALKECRGECDIRRLPAEFALPEDTGFSKQFMTLLR